MAMARDSRRSKTEARPAAAASALATWATELDPAPEDLALAQRSLLDTAAVARAGRGHQLRPLFEQLTTAGRLAATAHVLDFDDLHMPSTAHISAICVPAALATGGGATAYLAGAGVMARLGSALGWPHYSAGWHATCTAGAPAAAVTAAVARGLDAEQTAVAIALALPAAGGVQRAFGTASKSLQVGFAADAGVRAAALAAAGATADPVALEEWMGLVRGDVGELVTADVSKLASGDDSMIVTPTEAAVPGALAIKRFPCCYALQRPIAALSALEELPAPDEIERIRVYTPASSLKPLIRSRPSTGLEGKFSLEYALVAFLIDGRADFETFSDAAVQRPAAQDLLGRVEIHPTGDGSDLLAGDCTIEIERTERGTLTTTLDRPPGAPDRPPTDDEFAQKLTMCGAADLAGLTWDDVDLAERVDPG
jgi:2-methylcitrate dehydratase PrpD